MKIIQPCKKAQHKTIFINKNSGLKTYKLISNLLISQIQQTKLNTNIYHLHINSQKDKLKGLLKKCVAHCVNKYHSKHTRFTELGTL
ncbi:hypothetical protein N474_11880 [Pseudoalteromonas luteoviolacea CPMOR-2]|nr:hypothetical protein N474_11880 [Pseudoalteromonas luteoviolacea CPMOR-2]